MHNPVFRNTRFASTISALFLFLSYAAAQNPNVTANGMDQERLARIPVRMRALVEDGSMAGAVALVARRGRVVSLEAVGYQDMESKKPMRTDTIFDIRSVTKVVTAIGIQLLIEEGKLTLNDPVDKFLPEFKPVADKTKPWRQITIHHLLTHTPGLPLYRLPESQEIAIKRNRALAEYVTFLSKQQPEFEPGTQFRYSSGGFAILGRLIEIASGMTYEEFIRQRIFDPLGMKDSSFFVSNEKQDRVAAIYRRQDGKLERWKEIETYNRSARYPAPEFGMYSTAPDLAALCQMMLDGGVFKGRRILSPLSVASMTANHTLNIKSAETQQPTHHGLGWGLTLDPMDDFPLTSPGSYGHNGAFGALIWIDPQKQLVRIFLQHQLAAGRESHIFMAMAGAAVID